MTGPVANGQFDRHPFAVAVCCVDLNQITQLRRFVTGLAAGGFFDVANASDAPAFQNRIKKGSATKGMPPFESRLKGDELKALVAYVKSL